MRYICLLNPKNGVDDSGYEKWAKTRDLPAVNAICPDHVTTGLGAQQNEYFSKLLGFAKVEDYLANMAEKNPVGRPGLPSDTAAACLWLASDEAGYVKAEALNVSGGEEMH